MSRRRVSRWGWSSAGSDGCFTGSGRCAALLFKHRLEIFGAFSVHSLGSFVSCMTVKIAAFVSLVSITFNFVFSFPFFDFGSEGQCRSISQ